MTTTGCATTDATGANAPGSNATKPNATNPNVTKPNATKSNATRARDFLALHRPGDPLVMPNPWDAGSARLLAGLGFAALATTSGGFALTLGRGDGAVTGDEALRHCASIAGAVDVPVNADLEGGFGADPEAVAALLSRVPATGVAGASIEDWHDGRLLVLGQAVERVAAAREALGDAVVLTARAENFLRGNPDLADTITRLVAYLDAGADVLYAPAITTNEQIRAVVTGVDRPVNVLLLGDLTVARLAELGVARVSVGASFAHAAYGTLAAAADHLRGHGSADYRSSAARGRELLRSTLPGF